MVAALKKIKAAYRDALIGLLEEDPGLLKKSKRKIKKLRKKNKKLNEELYGLIKQMAVDNTEAGLVYILIIDLEQDILQSISLIVDTCADYVDNSLEPIRTAHESSLDTMLKSVEQYLAELIAMIQESRFEAVPAIISKKRAIFAQLENKLSQQIEGIKMSERGLRESMMIFRILLESKDLIAIAARFAKLYQRYYSADGQQKHLFYRGDKEEG